MHFIHGYALFIGVGADLPGTVTDATGLADLLRDPGRCAYPPAQVQVLTSTQATRDQILAALDRLAQTTNDQSTVIVYFSGHGYRVASTMGMGYYLMPYGYDLQRLYQTAISGSEFARRLRSIPAQKLILLLDCCHAGGVGETKGLELTKAPLPPEAEPFLAEGRGRVLIASSREDELSYAGTPYSAFTLALIEVLCGVGVAKQDGSVRVADLALHTREVVPGRTRDRQHPVLHFEQADNFVVAFYAGGTTTPKGLPFPVEPQIEPSPGAWATPTIQQTISGPGAVGIGVSVSNSPITTGNVSGTGIAIGHKAQAQVQQGGHTDALARAFAQIYAAIKARPEDPDVDKDEVTNTVKSIQQEAQKGEQANENKLTRWLRNLAGMAEDIFEVTVAALTGPQAAFATVVRKVAARMKQEQEQG